MTFKKVVRLCLSLFCWVHVPKAQAAPKLHLEPVELVGYAGDAVRVAIELPCGSRFFGLVAKGSTNGRTLFLAAAVQRRPVLCTGMPERVELKVDYLPVRSFQAIRPMPVQVATRINLARIDDIRVANHGDKDRIAAVYSPQCGRDLGTLIHRSGQDKLEISFAEQAAPTSGTCLAVRKTRAIPELNPGPKMQLGLLAEGAASMARRYSLRMAPISPGTLRSSEHGLTFSYLRACNEAPVGVALESDRETSTPRVGVGMIVARYENIRCDGRVNASVQEASLHLPEGVMISPMDEGELGDEARVVAPSRLVRGSGDRTAELQVGYLANCGAAPKAVYARDRQGNLAVGLLMHGGSSCKTSPSEVSLVQPYLASSVLTASIFPMRLK